MYIPQYIIMSPHYLAENVSGQEERYVSTQMYLKFFLHLSEV